MIKARRLGARHNNTNRWRALLIVITLSVAVGLMGVTMAQWSDTIYANEEVSTGELDVQFTSIIGNTYPLRALMSSVINRIDGKDNHQLYLTMARAWHHDDFYCNFELTNTGTVPIRLGNPTITRMDKYWLLGWKDAMDLEFNLPDSIDPGKTAAGTVRVHNNSPWIAGTYMFESEVPCYQWNQVNEQWWEDRLHIDGQLTVVTMSLDI